MALARDFVINLRGRIEEYRVRRAAAGDAVQILTVIEEAAAGSRPSEDGVSLALEAFPERAATLRRFRSICSKASSEVMQG